MVEIDAQGSSLVREGELAFLSENALGRLRQYVKEVAYDAEICDIKDRCFWIFIDDDDCL